MYQIIDKKVDNSLAVNKDTIETFGFGGSIFSLFWSLYSLLHVLAFFLALYLCFKCNGRFKFLTFLAACCCPWCYLIYNFAILDRGFCKGYVNGKPPKSSHSSHNSHSSHS